MVLKQSLSVQFGLRSERHRVLATRFNPTAVICCILPSAPSLVLLQFFKKMPPRMVGLGGCSAL
jgi:hypothetical protein